MIVRRPDGRWVLRGLVRLVPALAALLLVAVVAPADETRTGPAAEPRIRQPVALAFGTDGKWLYAANHRSGSLSVVDVASAQVVAEHDVGRALADLVALGPGGRLLAVDQEAGELLLLEARGRAVKVAARLPVGADPVRVLAAADGRSCAVASRWPRRVALVEVGAAGEDEPLRLARSLELPFSPRGLAWVKDGAKLVAADAFGGRLAVIDVLRWQLDGVRSLPAHNIRALALAPDGRTLALAYQTLSPLAQSRFDDVHWGSLIGNQLALVPVDALLAGSAGAGLPRSTRVVPLGEVGRAAGDPEAVAFDRLGNYVVAVGGVSEVAIGPAEGDPAHRLAVGRRPLAITLDPAGTHAYVACALDDRIDVVATGTGRTLAAIALGPRPELGPADRGERLFFDAGLSHDGWMSCQSCHTDGHTSGLRSDTLGDGSYGAPKRIPSLLGSGSTGPWTWLGGIGRLEDQVKKSIETTMQGKPPRGSDVEALAAYLRTLAPPSPVALADVAATAVERGRAVFEARKCAECHAPPEYTTAERYDVGLADEVGNRLFNPPSLRGVGLRAPLLHDGRAATLEEVFRTHQHPRGAEFSAGEVSDLIAFLLKL
jgi:YVTN family beta-propeller protein